MYKKSIPIEQVEPAFKSGPDSSLVEKFRENGWKGVPPIPVIEIPEELRIAGKRYYHTDGNHRHQSSLVAPLPNLECIVYNDQDNLSEVAQLTGGGSFPVSSYDNHIYSLKIRFK